MYSSNNQLNELVIFDFDGVLVDTEYATFKYYKKVLPHYNINLKEKDFKYKIGRKSIDFFKSVMGSKFDPAIAEKLTQQKRLDFQQAPEKYVTPIPGAFKLVKQCHDAGLFIAIGSQNELPMLKATIDKFKLKKYFSIIRSIQDITNIKPHPEIFQGIAEELNISPSNSVVIEDAPDGVAAAHAGGFNIIGVTTSADQKALSGAHIFVKTPAELSPDIIQSLNKKAD